MAITFGTDGVRGRAFDELTLVDAWLIGRAAAEVLGARRAVLGRDTRESGPALSSALAAGFVAGGVEPVDLGVVPTPAVAFVAGRSDSVGAMVSASHNHWADNGIKLFDRAGTKLSDAEQHDVENRLGELRELHDGGELAVTEPVELGDLGSVQNQVASWLESVTASIADAGVGAERHETLAGLSVVLDAANGSGSHVVAPALVDLGARVTALFNTPDGRNINEGCGSTHPQALAAAVVAQGADIGLALDGDADRLLAVDHAGQVVDGDHLMAMLATDMRDRGVLAGDRLVVTVMSNLGLLRAMQAADINVEVTPVGDRSVLQAMERLGANFGGEQSGHFIFSDVGDTGDGFLSGLLVLALMKRSGRSLADLAASAMVSFPQVLVSVAVSERLPDIADRIRADIDDVEAELGDNGRVLVRASGTEPVVRVMVEAADADHAQRACDRLCDAVRAIAR